MRKLRDVVIAGVGLTRFDSYDGEKGRPLREGYELGTEAILHALQDADMEWQHIQAAFCGTVYQNTGSGHQAIDQIGMTGIPIVNVENACSSAASAFRLAYQSVATELYDVVLAFGYEKMPRGFIRSTAWPPWQRYMGFNVQPANYAKGAVRYMEEAGATEEDFARVTVKNRRNGALNPNARFQKEVTLEEVLTSRLIATPMRLLHCCPLADGGAALILCSKDKLRSRDKVVTVAASVLNSGVYGSDTGGTGTTYGGGSVRIHADLVEVSAAQAWEMSGCGPEDMEVVQAYDTMAPGELWDIEKLGFCKKGEAPKLLRERDLDIGGRLPVNTDGGLMARGHPLGATAGAQIIEIYRQLRGEAGPRQVPGDPKIGLAHAMGAGPNSAVTILKR
jgi:acetyl-CoA acetyltransferase